ncbi:MAG: hypothetical protein JSU65_11695 [Candidatus Zixiibacteriota bacterium]|nr:MAG: hypothetical protein JSU65_11695 [candidate division Zixibacteria bacterium]
MQWRIPEQPGTVQTVKLSKRLKRFCVYRLAMLFVRFCNSIPRSTANFIGAALGFGAWKLLKRDRHKVHRHLKLVYGNTLSHAERESIGRLLFANMGKNLADLVRFKKHYESELRPLISSEGTEHLEEAYRRGKGFFGVTGHIGNFELLAVYIASLGYESAVIGRELYIRELDEWLVENRKALGLTNLSTTESPKKLLSWLSGGGAVGVLIDTDSSRVRSMPIPAFGRWSNTPVGQTLLALRTGAALVPMACLRTGENRYHVIIKPPVEVHTTGDLDEDIYRVTLKCTRELEEIVDQHRDQWVWMHNRWRTKV